MAGFDSTPTSFAVHLEPILEASSNFQTSNDTLPNTHLETREDTNNDYQYHPNASADEGENPTAYAMALNAQSPFDTERHFYAGKLGLHLFSRPFTQTMIRRSTGLVPFCP